MTDGDQLHLGDVFGDKSEASMQTSAPASADAASASPDAVRGIDRHSLRTSGPVSDVPATVVATGAATVDLLEATPTVHESTTASGEPAAEAVNPPRVFYLTNRMNLNGVLSSRMITPRASFQKYYSDLLELCPGWVPLFADLPPALLIERVVAERGAGAPVIVELADSVLDIDRPDGSVAFVHAALLADAKAIHFRDKRSLREHRARGYDNVHPHEELLQLSPELFESATDIKIVAPEQVLAIDWLHLDRVRGAINAILAAADSGEALAVAAGVFGADQLPADTPIPPWLSLAVLTGDELTPASESPAEIADRLIFQTAYQVLSQEDQSQSWIPSKVLETVALEIAAQKLHDDARSIVERSLQRVRELIDVEREFEPFRNSGGPYVAAKAFLMTLLRPDLGQLLEWSAEETGADVTTRLVGAVLAGSLRGLARESVALRNLKLDDVTARWAAQKANGEDAAISPGYPEFVSDASKTVLLLDANELCASGPLVPNPASLYEALLDDKQESARIRVSQVLKWPVSLRVHLPADAEVERDNAQINVTSSGAIVVETWVDEQAFLNRLRMLTGEERRKANDALTHAK